MEISLLRTLLLMVLPAFIVIVHSATVWFEDPPKLSDPCTIIVVQGNRSSLDEVHPAIECRDHASIAWFGTFGRIHLYLYYDTESDDTKRRDFELCLTSALPERIYIWWDSKNDSWSAISPPIWHAKTTKTDMCRRSKNGTMDLYLEPPWAYVNYVTHVTWKVTFVDELPPEEQIWPSSPTDKEDEPEEGSTT